MPLTDDGRQRLADIAAAHGFSVDAAQVLLTALSRGDGHQAQFSHPELGGMGQWSRGGMTMIGDMFNHGLKARVDAFAQDLSGLIGADDLYRKQSPSEAGSVDWPDGLGAPSSTGAQNGMEYAVFPASRRLAVRYGGQIRVYDTGSHQINGVSQQQWAGRSLTFTGNDGPVSLDSLKAVPSEDQPDDIEPPAVHTSTHPEQPPAQSAAPASMPAAASQLTHEAGTVFAIIVQAHELMSRGILTQAEFDAKKEELLRRL